MERKASCPAVSQICILTFLSFTEIFLARNSQPIVISWFGLNWFLAYLDKIFDLPTALLL